MGDKVWAFGMAAGLAGWLAACQTTSDPASAPVADEQAQSATPVSVDPRARVSMMNPGSRIPDHVSQPVGPMAQAHAYSGSLQPRRMHWIEADPEKGFHWPYFLFLPEIVTDGGSVLVIPNNDGLFGAPFETHRYWAGMVNEQAFVDFGRHLGTPVLTPVFPRPLVEGPDGNLYIHALSRAAMTAEDPRHARPDLQLVAMLDDALGKLSRDGHALRDDALLWGFSAAGDFVTRMAMLHPDRVRAVAAGGVGGLPILPLEQWDDEPLTYPLGVGDLVQVGARFRPDLLKRTPMLLFQGGSDENDSVKEPPFTCDDYGSDSYSCEQALWVNDVFGTSPPGRVGKVASLFEVFGMEDFRYLVLPGVEHRTPDAMDAVVRGYFACVLADGDNCARWADLPRE